MMRFLLLTVLSLCCFNCQNNADRQVIQQLTLKAIAGQFMAGGEVNMFVSAEDQLYLSWVAYLNDSTDALQYATLVNDFTWSSPVTIDQGSDWFVNWADFPSLVVYPDSNQTIAAHWLQTSAAGTYDYDIKIAQSSNQGQSWQAAFRPHLDGRNAEHGFVSMIPISSERILATWLDGRFTKEEFLPLVDGKPQQQPAMTLRAAQFDTQNNLYEAVELDHRVCDCCQTSIAITDQGPIIAYRDRSMSEIRDISIVRQVDGEWTRPKIAHADNWHMPGCPVNGPSLSADGSTVALAWFTRAEDQPVVQIAFSKDAGANFSEPIRIDDGNPLGRIDVVLLNEEEALVTWLETKGEAAEIRLAHVNSNGKVGPSYLLSTTSSARKSGFPILVQLKDRIILAWTVVNEENSSIQTAEIVLPQ